MRLFAYSGRNLYRPGESSTSRSLARDADSRPMPASPCRPCCAARMARRNGPPPWAPEKFSGYYRKPIELPADAATGSWNLELRADPAAKVASTVMRISVEEFLPERMKLDLATQAGTIAPEGGWQIDIAGSYLYGARHRQTSCSAW